jgi:HlyD family secretion protein
MKKKKIILIIALLIFIAYGAFQFWRANHLKLTGTLEMTEHSLGTRVPARLVKLFVDEGDPVKKGELIATLDRYEQAKRDFDRIEEIFKAGGATQQTYEEARLTLEDQEIISPVDGVVLLKVREAGEVLSAGSPVIVVGDDKLLWVRVFVPEDLVSHVKINESATLKFDGIKKGFKGHVSYIAPRAEFTPRNVQTPEERVTQTFSVKVVLDDMQPYLRPGVAADVKLDLKEK